MHLNLMKLQAFILTRINEDKRNIVHLACNLGQYKLLAFLMEKVRELEIENNVTRALDEMDLPPLYLLCARGYRQKFCEKR